MRPIIRKAVITELIAAARFRSLGFRVRRTKQLGPDLTCSIGKLTWLVEVKPAQPSLNGGIPNGCYTTAAVTKHHRKEDLVAIVMPNRRVYIESMTHHLKACAPSGRRGITALVKEFGLHPLKTVQIAPIMGL